MNKTIENKAYIKSIRFIALSVFCLLNFCLVIYIYVLYNSVFDIGSLFQKSILSCIMLYILSHILRVLRLSILLIEEKLSVFKLIYIHFLTSWGSFLIPFKLGELFSMSELSYLTGNIRKGIVTVWLLRFLDALLLLGLMLLYILYASKLPSNYFSVFVVILIFIFITILCVKEFRHTYEYITKLVINKSETKKGIVALKIMNQLKLIVNEVPNLAKGRVGILFAITVLVWIFEILALLSFSSANNLDFLLDSFVLMLDGTFYPNLILITSISSHKVVYYCVLFLFSLILFVLNIVNKLRMKTSKKVIKRKSYFLNKEYYENF